jgi:hypothetical protein
MPPEQTILDKIFSLQERVLLAHVSKNPDIYDFISQCIEALADFGVPDADWTSLSLPRRVVFNFFQGDAVSTLISAARLALHGCETDAYALMRVVVESLTVFEYIVEFNRYDSAFHEILDRAPKGKRFSKELSYATAIKQLGIADRRIRLRGQLSTLGAHISPSRLAMSHYQRDGETHMKAGVSLANPRIKAALEELASLCLFAIRVIDDFFSDSSLPTASAFHSRRMQLDEAHESLKSLSDQGAA